MVPLLLRWVILLAVLTVYLEARYRMRAPWRVRPNGPMRRRINKATTEDDWSYQGEDDGPDTWKDNYPNCGAPLQSPIDLPSPKARSGGSGNVLPTGLKLKGYDKLKIKSQTLKHDGWTVVYYTKGKAPSFTFGDGGETFKLVQFHTHWGPDETVGSEHTVKGVSSPMEIHFVHASKAGNLAVLGVLAQVNEEAPRDSGFFKAWQCFADMEEEGDSCKLKKKQAVSITPLLPKNRDAYWRYNGSTTTPPCSLNVIWTVFHEKVDISRADLALLRTMIGRDGKLLTVNNRPVQPLDGRPVHSTP